ncbi:MAG: type VI secretion system tip protein TssI/VgrG [Desulfovibrionaceae bacterium]|nr:type VI secretion system tip protein TssI/VgrG [Desulfovibrionaceae bacterium]
MDNAVFTFLSSALDKDTFEVLHFSGREAIAELYDFEILLLSSQADIDAATVLQGTATFTIRPPFAPQEGLEYHGIPASFEMLHRMGGRYVYRVRLRHKLWWLTLVRHNRVFLDQSPLEACALVLRECGLAENMDFVWKCRGSYPKREFICQYDESDFAFLSRWLERLGIYYWFEQDAGGPRCVLGDAAAIHSPLPGNEFCDFVEPSGLNPENPGLVVADFQALYSPLPREVCFRNYNPQKPDLDLTVSQPVSPQGRGVFYRYGGNYATPEEGRTLARVEAESLLCRAARYSGRSHNPALRPGYIFTLRHHYRALWNQPWLTVSVRHEGSQARLVARALGISGLTDADRLYYRNEFTCIPADTQFRSARVTPWPQVAGSVPAKVDGQGSGQYAELDEQGRYKVILPFDASGRGQGKASCWLRMMQPYAGEGMGFHAPLHKGTEVMVTFVCGDPDQPLIAAAVPNPVTPSPVTDANASQISLHSATGQKFHIEDAQGREHILFSSADGANYIKIGKF